MLGLPGSYHRLGEGKAGGSGSKLCSQCRAEPATGSCQMDSGRVVRVGNKCRRAMGIKGKRGQNIGLPANTKHKKK